jgi:hypothetical protein
MELPGKSRKLREVFSVTLLFVTALLETSTCHKVRALFRQKAHDLQASPNIHVGADGYGPFQATCPVDEHAQFQTSGPR